MPYPPPDPATDKTNATDQDTDHPDHHNELAQAIIDIVDELGADPKGSSADLTDRLTALVADIATKADEADAVMDGDTASGDLSGTYPDPSVVDDSHGHTASTVTLAADDLSDVSAASPDADDVLQWSGSAWVAAALAAGGYEPIVDTKAVVLASTPTGPQVAFTTDTGDLLFYDGTNWKIGSLRMVTKLVNPDAGWTQDNDRLGYGQTYIAGKRLYDVALGAYTDDPTNGALHVDMSVSPPTLSIYLRDQWNRLFYDLQMISGDLEHVPTNYEIDVRSGNSNVVGLNGTPIVQGYRVDAGAYPFPDVVSGGTF